MTGKSLKFNNRPQPVTAEQKADTDIEGVIFDISRYAIHDGPGIRTTVFFKGCPLQCRWCHNPESYSFKPQLGLTASRCIACGICFEKCPSGAISTVDGSVVTDADKCTLCGRCAAACPTGARDMLGRTITVSDLMEQVKKDIVFYQQSGGGVTFSGGEPLAQPDFLCELLRRCRDERIHTAVDTTCFAEWDVIERIAACTDLFICDIKHSDSETHRQLTGQRNELILDNIKKLAARGSALIIRIPLIPGLNDDKTNIENTCRFILSLETVSNVDILPYNPGGVEKTNRLLNGPQIIRLDPPAGERIAQIARIISGFGFEVTIGG